MTEKSKGGYAHVTWVGEVGCKAALNSDHPPLTIVVDRNRVN